MEGMEAFRRTIKEYLDNFAEQDEVFAEKYRNPYEGRTVEKCCEYIIGSARARCTSQAVAMPDEEVYGLAVHYFEEEKLDVPKAPTNCRIVGNFQVTLTEEDKAKAKQEAISRWQKEVIEQMQKPKEKPKAKQDDTSQLSLFGDEAEE